MCKMDITWNFVARSKKACFDYMENNFVNACILQFPYGRGGFDELQKSLMVVLLHCQLI